MIGRDGLTGLVKFSRGKGPASKTLALYETENRLTRQKKKLFPTKRSPQIPANRDELEKLKLEETVLNTFCDL